MGVLVAQVQPGLRFIVMAQVSINLGVAEAGGGIEITALDLSVPVARGFNIDSKKDALAVGLSLKGMSGRMYVFASIGPCPFCVEINADLLKWNGLGKLVPLHPGVGMCAECQTTCVYGICDRKTGESCECAVGYNGQACDVPCPGLDAGNPICNDRGVQECDDVTGGNCVDEPELGCRWDEKQQTTTCMCREPYFGADCLNTFPGVHMCKWTGAELDLTTMWNQENEKKTSAFLEVSGFYCDFDCLKKKAEDKVNSIATIDAEDKKKEEASDDSGVCKELEPCENNGICRNDVQGITEVMSKAGYTCKCQPKFGGTVCNEIQPLSYLVVCSTNVH